LAPRASSLSDRSRCWSARLRPPCACPRCPLVARAAACPATRRPSDVPPVLSLPPRDEGVGPVFGPQGRDEGHPQGRGREADRQRPREGAAGHAQPGGRGHVRRGRKGEGSGGSCSTWRQRACEAGKGGGEDRTLVAHDGGRRSSQPPPSNTLKRLSPCRLSPTTVSTMACRRRA